MNPDKNSLREGNRIISWSEASSIFDGLNKNNIEGAETNFLAGQLFRLIGEASPEQFDLLCLSYEYGEHIVEDGMFKLPRSMNDREIINFYTTHFKRSVPVGFSTNSNIEIFEKVELNASRGHYYEECFDNEKESAISSHTRPLHILRQGQLFGLYQFADNLLKQKSLFEEYSLSAGEISLYLGIPHTSSDLLNMLKRFMPGFAWKNHHRPSLIVQHYIRNLARPIWKCEVILIPDFVIENLSYRAKLFLDRAYMSQIFQELEELRCAKSIRNAGASKKEKYLTVYS